MVLCSSQLKNPLGRRETTPAKHAGYGGTGSISTKTGSANSGDLKGQ